MNCEIIQRRLLALPEPAEPPSGVRAHLDDCPFCQELQRRLVQIDRNIALVAVPPSAGPAAFLQRFQTEETNWEKAQRRFAGLHRWQKVAGAMAASLLLFFLAWSIAPHDNPRPQPVAKVSPPDRLLKSLMDRNVKLAISRSPREQVETLAGLSEDLRGQTLPLFYYPQGKEGKETLKDLASWYSQVVDTSVVRAEKLPREQRKPVLNPIIKQLELARDSTEQLARDSNVTSVDHPLYTMASVARSGKAKLDELVHEDGVGLAPLPHHWAQPAPEAASLRRLVLLPSVCAAVSAVARADNPSPAVMADEQAKRFQHNRALIHALVANCLDLVKNADVVQRAASCSVVADRLAEEMQRAIGERDLVRTDELAKLLQDVLLKGVAFNLTSATAEVEKGGEREPEMLRVGDQVKRSTEQLEAKLQSVSTPETQEQVQRVVRRITDARAKVYEALKGRGTY